MAANLSPLAKYNSNEVPPISFADGNLLKRYACEQLRNYTQ